MNNNIVSSFVEVDILDSDNFLKIKETLTRMGVANTKSKTLFQSCHILHKQGKYYITHFKEMMALDGKKTTFNDQDKARRNKVAETLEKWGLCRIVDRSSLKSDIDANLFVLPYRDKTNWTFVQKYKIGNK